MGIYAVEKADYAELRRDKCESITKLKELTRQFKAQGFKVWSNGLGLTSAPVAGSCGIKHSGIYVFARPALKASIHCDHVSSSES